MAAKDIKRVIKVGTKVKIIGNTAGHQIPIGRVVVVSRVRNEGGNPEETLYNFVGQNYAAYARDIAPVIITKKELLEEKAKLLNGAADIDTQIKIMEETGMEEYDDEKVRILMTLKEI